jgi:hypothetical protein
MACSNGRYARSGRVASGRSQTTVARRQRGMSRRLGNLGLCRFRVVRAHQGLIVQHDACVPQLGLCIDAPRPIQSASRRRGRAFAAASPPARPVGRSPPQAYRRQAAVPRVVSRKDLPGMHPGDRLRLAARTRGDPSISSHKQIGRSLKRQAATWQERQELVF